MTDVDQPAVLVQDRHDRPVAEVGHDEAGERADVLVGVQAAPEQVADRRREIGRGARLHVHAAPGLDHAAAAPWQWGPSLTVAGCGVTGPSTRYRPRPVHHPFPHAGTGRGRLGGMRIDLPAGTFDVDARRSRRRAARRAAARLPAEPPRVARRRTAAARRRVPDDRAGPARLLPRRPAHRGRGLRAARAGAGRRRPAGRARRAERRTSSATTGAASSAGTSRGGTPTASGP